MKIFYLTVLIVLFKCILITSFCKRFLCIVLLYLCYVLFINRITIIETSWQLLTLKFKYLPTGQAPESMIHLNRILDGGIWCIMGNIQLQIYSEICIKQYRRIKNCSLMLYELKMKCHNQKWNVTLTTRAAFTVYCLTSSNFSTQLGTKTKCWNSWVSPWNSNFNFCSALLNVTSATFLFACYTGLSALPVGKQPSFMRWESNLCRAITSPFHNGVKRAGWALILFLYPRM